MKLAEDLVSHFSDSQNRTARIREEIKKAGYSRAIQVTTQEQPIVTVEFTPNALYQALLGVSEPLAKSYAQVKLDLDNAKRLSWAGTAHEIRQILVTTLDLLAPDDEVVKQPGFQYETNNKGEKIGVTRKQRVNYILKKNGAGSSVRDIVKHMVKLDEMIEELVPGIYARASDAAHRFKGKSEVERIMAYFETFMPDLLDY